MWGHYASNHTGLCLGFDVDESIAMPITYISKRLSFDELFTRKMTKEEISRISNIYMTTKFSHWRYENEVRITAILDPSGDDIQFSYFCDQVKLRSVHVGVRSDITRSAIFDALGSDFRDEVKVVNTRLAFRSFKIVTQRNRNLWK
ncbi:DUF2971 domain-containing protein [Sandarakinorhabdus oryzae]|uniref:DUF2971 domain-containing protein n=1 Tax=Sandarakinorhabdus oryzae TaxID=2675220 RepID=UPI0038B43F8B